MSGDFNVTVYKLIRHWCPSLAEKELKWVHQLDFGTLLRFSPCLTRVVASLVLQPYILDHHLLYYDSSTIYTVLLLSVRFKPLLVVS